MIRISFSHHLHTQEIRSVLAGVQNRPMGYKQIHRCTHGAITIHKDSIKSSFSVQIAVSILENMHGVVACSFRCSISSDMWHWIVIAVELSMERYVINLYTAHTSW